MKRLLRFLKDWTLPVAISIGVALYFLFTRCLALHAAADVLTPWVERLFPFNVFLILWATFTKVDFRTLRLPRWALRLTAVQIASAAVLLGGAMMLRDGGSLVVSGALACVIAPCATASPVVTGKLGGNIQDMTAYVLISSLLSALFIPFCAAMLAPSGVGSLATMVQVGVRVLWRVGAVLVLPLILGCAVRYWLSPLYRWVVRHSDLPFYLWCLALATTSGITVRAIDQSALPIATLLALAAGALLVCLAQFSIGRRIGHCFNSRVEGGQALGQKNTALIIWATSTFFNPATSLAPGCYVLWQNIVNSWQIHRARHVKQAKTQRRAGE